jgi:hypothetical protein
MNSNARRKKRTVKLAMKTVAVVVVAGTESSGGHRPHRGEREVGAPGSTALGRLINHTAEMTRDKGRVAL